jgi:polyisoprenoid-binding protein YceI
MSSSTSTGTARISVARSILERAQCKVTLDPATWTVHAEADKGGVRYVIDGKMENIGAYARFITGTWQQGSQKGDFKVTRN